MKITTLMIAASAAALMAAPAFAGPAKSTNSTTATPPVTSPAGDPTMAPSNQQSMDNTTTVPAPAATGQDMNTSDDTAGLSTNVGTPSAMTSGTNAATVNPMDTGSELAPGTVTTSTVTNGPVPDTAENRARYGGPMSRAGKRTAARGN